MWSRRKVRKAFLFLYRRFVEAMTGYDDDLNDE